MGEEFAHVLDSLGWAVLHSLWQGGFAFLIVIIWRFLLRGRSPALRHAGQMGVLIGCFLAFLWTFAIYLGLANMGMGGGATPTFTNIAETPRLLTGLIAPFDTTTDAATNLSRITPVLACLWALGFAALSLRYAFAFGQVQQLRTVGLQRPGTDWADRFMRLAQQSGVTHKVQLYLSANVAGPITLGLIKPVVLVPIGFLTSLPADQVEAILRHELAHIRRYDYALNFIQIAVKTVLFFHPAIHIICRWADQDREQACDDIAVREGQNPLILARGLAALRLQAKPSFSLAATGTGKDMPLLERLTRLAGHSPKRGRPEHILMSVMSALLMGSVYLGATSQAEAHPVPPALPDTVVTAEIAPVAPPAVVDTVVTAETAPPAPTAPTDTVAIAEIAPPVPPVQADTVVTVEMASPPPALQDRAVTMAITVPSTAPVAPAPPVMQPFNPISLTTSERVNTFMDIEKTTYRAFVNDMEVYARELDQYLERTNLDEDEREGLADEYIDLIEDISDEFEERREDIEELYEDLYEDHMELQAELKEAELERQAKMRGLEAAMRALEDANVRVEKCEACEEKSRAEIQGLEAALKGLDAAERDLKNEINFAVTQAQHDAFKQARKSVAKAQSDARMRLSQASTARSVARAEADKHREVSAELHKEVNHSYSTEIDRPSQKRHEDFRDVVMRQLLKDGLIKSVNETVFLSHPNGKMSLNGEPLPNYKRGKYCNLWDAYGFTDDHTEIKIKPESMTISTDWENGQHKTRITYGTFHSEKTSH